MAQDSGESAQLAIRKGEEFATWLNRAMATLGISIQQVSDDLQLHWRTVARYSNGGRPSADEAAALARYFGIPEADALWLAGYLQQRPRELYEQMTGLAAADPAFNRLAAAWKELSPAERELFATLIENAVYLRQRDA